MVTLAPTVGQWYIDNTTNELFEVVAIDAKSHSIEVQYSDGDISEYDLESWNLLMLTRGEAPEDANAGYGLVSDFDEDREESSYISNGFNNPLDAFETDTFGGYDDIF